MNSYVTGELIKRLREGIPMTQSELAEKIGISDKAVSRWETGRGYPDISLLQPLASALGISVAELLAGNEIINNNTTANIKRSKLYVCPICGNVLWSIGECNASCCGISLLPCEADNCDEEHIITAEICEDEYFIKLNHEMTKEHHISFLAALSDDGMSILKLYPEGNAEGRFKIAKARIVFAYCNRHGLFSVKLHPKRISNTIL